MSKVKPFLWFDNQAEEAANLYVTLIKNSRVTSANPMVVTFELDGVEYMALNGGPHYQPNEAFSLFVDCTGQEEVDELWDRLTADGGQPGECGWLKDKFGVSWQIIPRQLMELMNDPDPAKAGAVQQAMLKMSKIDVKALEDAHASA
ncbi:VOC family protein [Catelliglobosispora koreensis]|uniref:VOC family protein n=1 Tax=Catelliglobosispora koreensis TaxID=129052 RepID=UPI00037CC994|nr:VOC family protein [Catelliglobosispora koreensis]